MEKISSIKDLVIQTLTNGSEIKAKAESGDALSCFQMGMIYLLGIDTKIDFKKASSSFGNQSLSGDSNANLLLGFIAECNGYYSSAFHYYANTESSEKDNYLDKVIKGRNHIQDYLRKLDLPITMNKEISSIFNDYSKSKTSKTGACIKIAAICEDEQTCLEAAKNLYDAKDYISAIQWLKKGNISADNAMYKAINDMFEKSKTDLLESKVIQIIDLNSGSLLSNEDPTPFLNKVKKSCDVASRSCSNEWKDKAKSYIGAIIKDYKDKEHQAYLDALAEEEARKRKRKKLIKYGAIAISILFFYIVGAIGSSSDEKENSENSPTIEESLKEDSNGSQNQETKRKKSDYPKAKDTEVSSDDFSSNNNFFHNFNSGTSVSHYLVGTFTDATGSYPIEITFSTSGNNVSEVVYKNISVGVKIPLKCSIFKNNEIRFEGKDGKNIFVISLENLNEKSFEGTAVVGNKEFQVAMEADCSH